MKNDLVNEKATRHDNGCDAIPTPCGRGSSCASEASYKCRGGVNSSIDSQNPSPQPSPARRSIRRGEGACHSNSDNPQSLLNDKRLFAFRKRFAFTLAEVLITLGVIGIVAAMTIPTLVNNYQEKVFVTGAKKFYSLISQAVQLAVMDNGLPETWDLSDPENMIKPLMPYLKITDYCTSTNGKICYNSSNTYYKNGTDVGGSFILNGRDNAKRPAFRLNDGTVVGIYIASNMQGLCGEFTVDVNGEKGPNTYGKDIFIFNLAKNGTIKPSGTPDFPATASHSFDKGCLNSNATGWGCTAWVVQNGNMDYLHCDDLSWNGKHKCSD